MLDEMRERIGRAKAKAAELGVAVSIAAVDSAGHLVALERMDGAGFATPEIAWGKAWTAAAFGVPSAALAERMGSALPFSAALSAATHGRFTPRQGALPLPGGGGIGASGGTGEQDEEIVRAGLD
jgi:glc operon protein GlcG